MPHAAPCSHRLQRLDGHPPDRRCRWTDRLSAEIEHRHGDATHLCIELANVEGNAVLKYRGNLAPQELRLGHRFRGVSLQFDSLEKALELLGPQRSENDFSERRAMGRTQDADAVR